MSSQRAQVRVLQGQLAAANAQIAANQAVQGQFQTLRAQLAAANQGLQDQLAAANARIASNQELQAQLAQEVQRRTQLEAELSALQADIQDGESDEDVEAVVSTARKLDLSTSI